MIEKTNSNSNYFYSAPIKETTPEISFRPAKAIDVLEQGASKNFSCRDCLKSFFQGIWSLITWPFVQIYECFCPTKDPFETTWLSVKDFYYYFLHLSRTYDFTSFAFGDSIAIASPEKIADYLKDFPIDQLHNPLALPIHLKRNHWGLLFIDPAKRTIEYYDSKEDYEDPDFIHIFLNDVKSIFDSKMNTPFEIQLKIDESLQPDTYQCGIWLLYFLENRLKHPDIDFNQLDHEDAQEMIAEFRKHVKRVIDRVENEVQIIYGQDRNKLNIASQVEEMEGDAHVNYFQLWKERYRKFHESRNTSRSSPT